MWIYAQAFDLNPRICARTYLTIRVRDLIH